MEIKIHKMAIDNNNKKEKNSNVFQTKNFMNSDIVLLKYFGKVKYLAACQSKSRQITHWNIWLVDFFPIF